MQHEAAIGLHRTAEIDRQAAESRFGLLVFEGDADTVEQACQIHFHRPVDDDADGTLRVVFADVGQRARKIRVGHGGHGDQEMVGETDGFHECADIVICTAPSRVRRPFLPCPPHLSGSAAICVCTITPRCTTPCRPMSVPYCAFVFDTKILDPTAAPRPAGRVHPACGRGSRCRAAGDGRRLDRAPRRPACRNTPPCRWSWG
jgi:hypothetical protein